MRVALFTDTFLPEINGVATSTATLQKALQARGHFCVVVTTNPFSKKVTFENDVIRIPGIELKKLYGYYLANIYNGTAMRILKGLNLDLVHVHTEASIGIFGKTVARRLKLPYVYTYHTMYEDYTYYATKGRFDSLAKSIVKGWSRWQAELANEFVSPSTKTKEAMREYGVNRYINVVPTGIDFSRFKKENIDLEKVASIKKELGIEDTFNLIYVGRVAKEKSIDIVIRGFANYLKSDETRKTKLIIVGGGPALIDLKDLALQLKITEDVIFLGPVSPDEVALYYHLGDIFVSASTSETQGLTFMEAMAAYKLLLCCYDDNLINVIKDGVTGFFFDSEIDFGDKVKKVINLSNEEMEKMLDAAFELADEYSIERFGSRMEHVYERALRNSW
ncbi:MAG TPA: glycosyltransferase [Bacilli bacterium]|jgi:1,2-diacylglycerol 3-alpha-glucosyltransferase|nr:glycosyltransferase [Bacilli bacterium]HOF65374.1 glycosyltransferase [Bacilli bacterium]